jgi:hypothetical protein
MRASRALIKTHSNGSFTNLVIGINRGMTLHSGSKLGMASIGYLGKLDRANQPLCDISSTILSPRHTFRIGPKILISS